jgi:prepilin-type N-terminal cleavage/methylation domain-containing protein
MKSRDTRRGFTLAELLVVAAIIGLVLVLMVPMIRGLFSAGADAQAAGQMSAMLGAARGQAIDLQRPAALMLGAGKDQNGWQKDGGGNATNVPVGWRGWAVVMRHYNTYTSGGKNLPYFIPSADIAPQSLPGSMACGAIATSGQYMTGTGTSAGFANAALAPVSATDDSNFDNFTNFAIVFGPDGTLVDQVDSGNPVMANYIAKNGATWVFQDASDLKYSHIVWRATYASDQAGIDKMAILPMPAVGSLVAQMVSTVIADPPTVQPGTPSLTGVTGKLGVRAYTIFDYKFAKAAAQRGTYINTHGNFFCVNPYTGQVIPPD